MSEAEIKMIVDMITSLGAEGRTAFIWWLVLDRLVSPVCWALLLYGALKGIRTIVCTASSCMKIVTSCRDRLIPNMVGSELSLREISSVGQAVARLSFPNEEVRPQ